MQLLSMECPGCGAHLEINPTLKEAYCQYCGTKLLIDGMQATNILGQPVADEHLLQMLREVSPLISKKEELESSLTAQKDDLESTQSRINSKTVSKIIFNPQYEQIYKIVLLICTAMIFISILFVQSLGLAFVFVLATIAMWQLYKNTVNYRGELNHLTSTKDSIKQLEKDMAEIEEKLKPYNIDVIPSQYRNGTALKFIYNALNSQRATTMQQAINLYEEDKRNRRFDEIQEQQLQSLKIIGELAKDNAFQNQNRRQ